MRKLPSPKLPGLELTGERHFLSQRTTRDVRRSSRKCTSPSWQITLPVSGYAPASSLRSVLIEGLTLRALLLADSGLDFGEDAEVGDVGADDVRAGVQLHAKTASGLDSAINFLRGCRSHTMDTKQSTLKNEPIFGLDLEKSEPAAADFISSPITRRDDVGTATTR